MGASQLEGAAVELGTPARVRTELIEDEHRLRAVLRALLQNNTASFTCSRDGQRTSVAPPMLEADRLRWSAPVQVPVELELSGYNSLFRCTLEVASDDGHTTPLPKQIKRVRRRWQRRASLLEGHALTLDGLPLSDISHDGLSVTLEPTREAFTPGTVLPSAKLRVGTEELHLDLQTRSVTSVGSSVVCRFLILAASSRDAEAWRRVVDARLYSNTDTSASWADELWSLYGKCGYFNLSGKSVPGFAELKQAFVNVARRLAHAPQLGCHVVFRSQAAGVVAGLSVLKVYSGTWLGFQMAKVKGDTPEGVSSRRVLREIHERAYEHAQRDGGLAWILSYPQVKHVWSRAVHHDFPRRWVDANEAAVVRFQAVELVAQRRRSSARADISAPTADELAELLAWLWRSRGAVYCEALDLTARSVDLADNAAAWHGQRLARSRRVFVLRSEGEVIAAAIAELGEDGAHLYGLIDLTRIYLFRSDAHRRVPELLDEVRHFYAEHGKTSFVLFREEGTELDLSSLQVQQDLGFADMSILSANLLPELLECLHEITAPREASDAG